MNCFQHPQKPAVGNCTYCGRGLCQDCTTVVDGKLSCRGTCQQETTRARRILAETEATTSQRKTIYETSSKVYQRSFVFFATIGILLIVLGIILLFSSAEVPGAILIGLGLVLLINGVGMGRAGKKMKALAAQVATQGTQS